MEKNPFKELFPERSDIASWRYETWKNVHRFYSVGSEFVKIDYFGLNNVRRKPEEIMEIFLKEIFKFGFEAGKKAKAEEVRKALGLNTEEEG